MNRVLRSSESPYSLIMVGSSAKYNFIDYCMPRSCLERGKDNEVYSLVINNSFVSVLVINKLKEQYFSLLQSSRYVCVFGEDAINMWRDEEGNIVSSITCNPTFSTIIELLRLKSDTNPLQEYLAHYNLLNAN